jgi:hypothetical protein
MNKGLQGQRGAVLLVVLVVSLLSSLLVFTSIQENQLQTRLSGNFHKKINAQLSAEQGMNESYRALHQALGAEPRIEWERLVQKVPSKGEGAMDAGNMLKPALARGDLHCVGATTLDEYRQYIEKDAALERRFQKVLVEEPSVEDTIAILRGGNSGPDPGRLQKVCALPFEPDKQLAGAGHDHRL